MKKDASHTALRMVQMVASMPHNRWVTTPQVHATLADMGYRVSLRTVQRDLVKLAPVFGLQTRGSGYAAHEWKRTIVLAEMAA